MQLSSKNQTILLLSDSHQEVNKLEYILTKESYDICVHLGDHFDSFSHDSEADAIKVCNFLKKWMFKPNFYSTFGNHDMPIFHNNPYTICSGFYKWKKDLVAKELGELLPEIRSKFKWYIFVDDFLCSHAGVNAHHFPPNLKVTKDGITKWLDTQIEYAKESLIAGSYHYLYGAGVARGGRQSYGSLLWQDFDAEFEPIEDLKQIVGHSSHPRILNHSSDGNLDIASCDNIDIDCHLSQYLLITNGKVQIKDYKDL